MLIPARHIDNLTGICKVAPNTQYPMKNIGVRGPAGFSDGISTVKMQVGSPTAINRPEPLTSHGQGHWLPLCRARDGKTQDLRDRTQVLTHQSIGGRENL